MHTTAKRRLTITCGEGHEVTKKQHTCFVHNLIADTMRPKPLITWKRDPKAEEGVRAYYTSGLADGTLITLRGLDEQPGVEFTYSRHEKLIYTATETAGDVNCDMHLAMLLHKVICTVTWAEMSKKPDSLAQLKEAVDKKLQTPQHELSGMHVSDVFRSIDVEELITAVLDSPNYLSIGIAKNNCPERQRIEALIRATVSYLCNVKRQETGVLMQSFGLKSLADGSHCGHLVTSPLAKVANAHVAFSDKYYGGLNPGQRNLKFAQDIIVNLLAGV